MMPKNCCNFVNKEVKTMARPIKETPIFSGSDAKRFEERMQNPPKVSSENGLKSESLLKPS